MNMSIQGLHTLQQVDGHAHECCVLHSVPTHLHCEKQLCQPEYTLFTPGGHE